MKIGVIFSIAILAHAVSGCTTVEKGPPADDGHIQNYERNLVEMGIKPHGMSEEAYRLKREEFVAQVAAIYERQGKEKSARRDAYFLAHPNLTPEIKEAISKSWFALGMTREDVEFSMGRPKESVSSGGIGSRNSEVWYYSTVTLTFVDGVVAHWTVYRNR